MEDISGNTHVLGAVRGEIYWKSQGDFTWSGFFGDDDGDEASTNNIVGYKEISDHGCRGIYKGDCIKERVALTATQIFCADTNEVCVFCLLFLCLKIAQLKADFHKIISRILSVFNLQKVKFFLSGFSGSLQT